MGGSMAETRAARVSVLVLLGVALAAPVMAACACLVSAPEPTPAAGCHAPPEAALTAGCCCIEARTGELDGDSAAVPTPRVAMTTMISVATPVGTAVVAPHPVPAPVRAAPPPHTVPLRL